MKHLLLFMLGILMFSSCQKDRLTANGDQITDTRTLNEFTSLHVSGASPVHVTYGNEYKVVLKGSSNLIPYFKTTLDGKRLNLSYKNANVRQDDIEIFVTMPLVKGTSLSGSGSVNIDGNFPSIADFDLSISGSGDISVNQTLNIDRLDATISGSGKAFFQKANVKEADIDISGSGDIHVQVADYLKARISGSGEVYYRGNPQLDTKVSGSGKVLKF
ncbi:head GIN domain-containing protein [Pedobacter insulae]|uniref:Putative auto-transporter adhesin, head GIN domain n=1 Tax=Pedobacter insulae TaxID=414048 RepID=A0A1I2WKH7_9SPHI|nr:head GIN domain-containing protein [Pedobacter insulae]SFH01147.1 Putative auto-transporter adhesin, head GIN domain [Pedobacter insulae]